MPQNLLKFEDFGREKIQRMRCRSKWSITMEKNINTCGILIGIHIWFGVLTNMLRAYL